MKVIPVVRIHEFKQFGKRFDRSRIHDLMEKTKEKTLYIIDEAGIRKNNPLVNIYQKLASSYELWVDSGPRESGDIVDLVFSGVKRIVIRPSLWKEIDLNNVRNMTDQMLVELHELSVENRDSIDRGISVINEYDGLVIYIDGEWKQRRFTNEEMVKKNANRPESFVYEHDGLNHKTWEQYGFTGLLVDIEHIRSVMK
jgi:hypothetical protein